MVRKSVVSLVCLVALMMSLLSGCGQDRKVCKAIEGKEGCRTYEPYGLLDKDELKSPDVKYKLIGWNIFWGVVGSETLLIPALIGALQLWEVDCEVEHCE